MSENTPTVWLMYGREKGKRSFRPINLKSGEFVRNLVFATIWHDKTKADKALDDVRTQNPDIEFELRGRSA